MAKKLLQLHPEIKTGVYAMDSFDSAGIKHSEQFVEIPVSGKDPPVLRVKTEHGWRTLDSLHNPDGESNTLLANVKASDFVLLGCGSGFLLKELIKRRPRHLFIITGSGIAYKKNRLILQENMPLLSDITLKHEVSPSKELLSELKRFFERFPAASVIIHPGEHKAYPELFNPLCVYIECLKQNIKKRNSFTIRKVLFPQQGTLLEPDIQEEFYQRGIEVIPVPSVAHARISCKSALEIITAHNPDIVFSINNRGSDRNGFIPDACRYANIPWVTWFLDQPHFLVSKYECRAGQQRTAFCWDTAGVQACQELAFDHISLLPLGVNQRRFTPGRGREELKGKLVYVGSPSFGEEERYFASLKRKPFAYRIVNLFLNSVIQLRIIPTVQEVYDVVQHEKIPQGYFTESDLQRIPAFILYMANLIYRINILKAISDFSPVVYGDGWEGLLPDQITVFPYVDYYRDLPEIYRSDSVHLSITHLQMRHYPNQRIFDAGACGRPVMTECLPGCEELFEEFSDSLFFKTHEELREKVATLLENKKLRRELGEQLRMKVIKNHTLSHRVASILSFVENNMPC